MAVSLKLFAADCKVFSPDSFWKESFLTGDIAESLALLLGSNFSKDELFISASLCNLGKFVMALTLPKVVDDIQAHVDNPKTLCTWRHAERLLRAPDHSILGEIGAVMWGLPNYVMNATSQHHHLKQNRGGTKFSDNLLSMTEVVALANQLSNWILLKPSRIDQTHLDYLSKAANLSKIQLEDFCNSLGYLAKRAA
jgi:HD-like signal output (HDOD) protein